MENVALKAIGKSKSAVEPNAIERALRGEFSATGHIPDELTDEEAGSLLKEGIEEVILARKTFFAEEFEQLSEQLGNVPVDETSLTQMIQELSNEALNRTGASRTRILQLKRQIQQNIDASMGRGGMGFRKPFSIDVLKQIRSSNRGQIGKMSTSDERRVSKIIDGYLKEAIDDSLLAAASRQQKNLLDAGDIDGAAAIRQLAEDALQHQRQLNQQYAEFIQNLNEDFRPFLGGSLKGSKDIGQFLDELNATPSAKLNRNFFNKTEIDALENFKTRYPQQFEMLKGFKQSEILKKSMIPGRNEIDIQKLLGNINKMPPQVVRVLFDTDKLRLMTKLQDFVATRPSIIPLEEGAKMSTDIGSFVGSGVNTAIRSIFDNKFSRTVLRTGQMRPVSTLLGQGAFQAVPHLMGERSLDGLDFANMYVVPEDRKPALAFKIMNNDMLSSTEKAKHMNLLNKHGYGLVIEKPEDKLTPRQRKLLRIYGSDEIIPDLRPTVEEQVEAFEKLDPSSPLKQLRIRAIQDEQ